MQENSDPHSHDYLSEDNQSRCSHTWLDNRCNKALPWILFQTDIHKPRKKRVKKVEKTVGGDSGQMDNGVER